MTSQKDSIQTSAASSKIHIGRIEVLDAGREPPLIKIRTTNQLGVLLKNVRKTKKLTQQQLADLSGVGRRFIVECEAGKPRLEFAKVLQVAAAAGIDFFAAKR